MCQDVFAANRRKGVTPGCVKDVKGWLTRAMGFAPLNPSYGQSSYAAARRALTASASKARSAIVSASAGVFRDAKTASASSVIAAASRAAFHCLSAASTKVLRGEGGGGWFACGV